MVVDRLVSGSTDAARLSDSIETALKGGEGRMLLLVENDDGSWSEEKISELAACADCGISFDPLAPRNFSFNSPYGACPE